MRRFDITSHGYLAQVFHMSQRAIRTTRNSVYLGLLVSASLATAGLSPALAADPTGDWKDEDGVATIRVAECNKNMWGVVVWEKVAGTDKNNPDVTKRNRPTFGLPILLNMKKDAKAEKWAGTIYNAKDGKSYKSTMEPTSPNELEIEGCVMGILCGGQTWTRVGPPIPSSPSNMAALGNTVPGSALPGASKMAPSATAHVARPGTMAPAPKGAVPAPKAAAGQLPATAAPDTDTIGDICLLPEVARLAH
jgi:uncharacterized protein (DUF2147 family)